MKKHYAQYGNTVLERQYCDNCSCFSFVIKNKRQCCESEDYESVGKRIKLMSSARAKRKKPPVAMQKEIIERQDNKCFYCGESFGTMYFNNSNDKFLSLVVNYDHIEPYSYSYNNQKTNFVASCQICNGIKSNLMFPSMEVLIDHVRRKRNKKTYYEKIM